MSAPLEVIGTLSKWVNAILIKFTGGTGDNEIQIPDDLASALDITEAGNSYLDFVTTDGSELIKAGKDVTITGNYPVEGYTTGKNILRCVTLRITPGGTPGTNITINDQNYGNFNPIALATATNLADDSTVENFTLNSGSTSLTMNLTETIVGMLLSQITVHDLNSSSTSEYYSIQTQIASGNAEMAFFKRGTQAGVDIRTIFDAGDLIDVQIIFITSS